MLHVHALIRANARRKVEHFWLAEDFGGEQAARLLPHDRRVQTFFDGGPDGECRRKVESVDRQVGSVAYTDFVDGVEEVIRRVPCEHVRQAGLHSHADERQETAVAPLRVGGELGGTKWLANFVVRVGRVRFGQVHGHVHVGATRLERRLENRVVQTWVARIDDDVDLVGLGQRHDLGLVVGIHLGGGETLGIVEVLQRVDATLFTDVGQHEGIEEGAGLGDGGHARPYSAGADDENATHEWGFLGYVGCGGIRGLSGYRRCHEGSCASAQACRDRYFSAGKQYVMSVNLSFAKTYIKRKGSSPTLYATCSAFGGIHTASPECNGYVSPSTMTSPRPETM